MRELVKRFWPIGFLGAFAACDGGSGGGSESNFQSCDTTSDCDPGFVCTGGQCARPEAGISPGTGGGAATPSGGATNAGGNPGSGGAASGAAGSSGGAANGGRPAAGGGDVGPDADSGNGPDAGSGPDADASTDGRGPIGDASVDGDGGQLRAPCFPVEPAAACGEIARFERTDPTTGWTLWRALPIEGAPGYAALLAHGDFPSNVDHYALATLDSAGGCATMQSAPWTGTPYSGVNRAISRGGTLAIVPICVQRNECGRALFLNGEQWIDPSATQQRQVVDVDVAPDGKVFLVSTEYRVADGAAVRVLIERWLAPDGHILSEHERETSEIDPVMDVAVLPNDTVALAFFSLTGADYVEFQSNAFETISTWTSTAGHIQTMDAHFPWIGVAGYGVGNQVWTGVLDGEHRTEVWTRTHADGAWYAPAVEVDATGAVNTTVWTLDSTFLILHETKTFAGNSTPKFFPNFPPPAPVRIPAFGGLETQANGTILLSTDFAGSYCE